jgi:flagellar biosynthesis protein FlhF
MKKMQKPIDTKSLEGRKFRFVVSSAEDAAKIIRERLGETARVLSVKQVNGKGLTRFLSSPQLEIIVTVPQKESKEFSKEEISESITSSDQVEKQPEVKTESYEKPDSIFDRGGIKGAFKVDNVLSTAGFDNTLIQGIKTRKDWKQMDDMPIAHALAEVSQWFRSEYQNLKVSVLGKRVAFFGAPGVGTTTALCKHLAQEVFIENKNLQVLKMDSENPNADDALQVFCDVIGAPIHKDTNAIDQLDPEVPLYIDCPATSVLDRKEWGKLKLKLNAISVDSKIMVINAAYDKDLIADSFNIAKEMDATHVVLTHMDEVRNFGKIWPFVLGGGLPVLFISCGQDVSSDVVNNVEEYLVNGTFPSIILN